MLFFKCLKCKASQKFSREKTSLSGILAQWIFPRLDHGVTLSSETHDWGNHPGKSTYIMTLQA